MELLHNIIIYQLYPNGHVRINISIGKRSNTFMLCFVKDPMEYLDAARKNRWNTNGRNDNSKGSNGIPLVQHEETNGRAMEGMITVKDPMKYLDAA